MCFLYCYSKMETALVPSYNYQVKPFALYSNVIIVRKLNTVQIMILTTFRNANRRDNFHTT